MSQRQLVHVPWRAAACLYAPFSIVCRAHRLHARAGVCTVQRMLTCLTTWFMDAVALDARIHEHAFALGRTVCNGRPAARHAAMSHCDGGQLFVKTRPLEQRTSADASRGGGDLALPQPALKMLLTEPINEPWPSAVPCAFGVTAASSSTGWRVGDVTAAC